LNKEQYLLIQLMEECAEVQQACAKALRFGLDEGYPGTVRTNKSDILKEIADLTGVIRVLEYAGIINGEDVSENAIASKERVVYKYMQISKSLGIL